MTASPCRRARRCAVGWAPVAGLAFTVVLAGCGSTHRTISSSALPPALVAQARPIGHGEQFHPPATGPVVGPCRASLGPRFGAHVELFAANRVVLIAAAIGTRPPLRFSAGRIPARAVTAPW